MTGNLGQVYLKDTVALGFAIDAHCAQPHPASFAAEVGFHLDCGTPKVAGFDGIVLPPSDEMQCVSYPSIS